MLASVIICTRNRAPSLARTLASLTRMHGIRDIAWELIVVNNGSTDSTVEVTHNFEDKLPLRIITEDKAGLSHARNAGVQAARGKYTIWTDDDVVVDVNWLSAYVSAFERWPTAVVFGGRIIPRFDPPVPRWLEENYAELANVFAYCDYAVDELSLSSEKGILPHGANYAIRTAEQAVNLYDVELGVGPGKEILGEETKVITDLLRECSGVWISAPLLEHIIPQERQTIPYVKKYHRAAGATTGYLSSYDGAPKFMGVPRFLFKRLAIRFTMFLVYRLLCVPKRWVRNLKLYSQDYGAIRFFVSNRKP